MRNQIKFVATTIVLVIALGALSSQVLAQYHDHLLVGGTDHVFVFKPVTMPAEYREYSMVEGREIVRLKCHVEAVAKSVNNTKVTLGQNASGERTIEEIALLHA